VIRRGNGARTETQPAAKEAPPGFVKSIEGEELSATSNDSGPAFAQDMRSFGRGWSGDKQLLWNCRSQASELLLDVPLPYSGTFDVSLALTRSYDFGRVQLELDGAPLGGPIDLYNSRTVRGEPRKFAKVSLTGAKHRLKVTAVGKNTRSKGYYFGLDWIRFDAVP
jgi:hypothetical protein